MRSNKERGYTLIEMLFSLMIFMVMTWIILQMVMVLASVKIKSHSINPMEWELFVINIKTENKTSVSTEVNNNQIYLSVKGEEVLIEQYKNMLRRRVDGSGHEVLLHGVKKFVVVKNDKDLYLEVTDQSNQVYSTHIYADLIGGERLSMKKDM